MLYKIIAQNTGVSFGDSDSDGGSVGSFRFPSNASIASNMTGKLEEQFENLQTVLAGLTGGTMSKLVSDLQDLSCLTEEDSITPKDLKRALVPFSKSIQAVQAGVVAIEKDLLALRASNDEITEALLTFEGYIIDNAVFFKKIDLVLSGVSVDEAEDEGDDFADDIRARNESAQTSVAAYTEGLNAVCLEVRDTIARRLGLEPLSSDYIGDPNAVRLTGALLSALSSAKVAGREKSDGSSVGGYKYREDFNTLRGEAHAEMADMLEVLNGSIAFPLGKNFALLKKQLVGKIQAQEAKFEQFFGRIETESSRGEEDALRQEALANIARDLATEVQMYQAVRQGLSALRMSSAASAGADALKPFASQLASFLMSPKDASIAVSLVRMEQQVDELLPLFSVIVSELPVRLSDLHDHLVLGVGLKESKGDKLDKKTLTKVRELLRGLRDQEDIRHYAVLDTIRTQFETNFSGVSAKKK